MNIGIIGSEAAKFTHDTEVDARVAITHIVADHLSEIVFEEGVIGAELERRLCDPLPTIVSGHCHLGGVDIWAEEEARACHLPMKIFPPVRRTWEGGYKQRNIQIAEASDTIYVITLRELPASYTGMKFNGCYHCDRVERISKYGDDDSKASGFTNNHIKSGACWTAWYAVEKLGKQAHWIII